MKSSRRGHYTLIALCAFLGVLLVLKPTQVPPLWYDEGFVLSLARNWVALGHYGHLLLGQPVPAIGSTSGFPVVVPVALSFRLFGIGVWQARLPGIVYTAATLGVLYFLARRLYDRDVAVLTIAVVSLFSYSSGLHPVLVGRQALGEIPALFYLLTGFAMFTYTRQKRFWPLLLAIIFWAIALQTKPQTLPFFVVCLSLPLAMALWQRRWRTARLLAVGLFGALLVSLALSQALKFLQSHQSLSPSSIVGLYDQAFDVRNWLTYWLVLDPAVRLGNALMVTSFGMPLVLGLCYSARKYVRNLPELNWDCCREVGRLMLWTFAASWLAWFLLLSIGWARYLFPAIFSGSVFVALLLRRVAGPDLGLLRLIQRGARVLHERHFDLSSVSILLTAIFVPASVGMTLIMLGTSYLSRTDDSVPQTVDYFATDTPTGSVIETTEVELFFLLDRPYHYPPVSIMPDLNRRTFLAQNPVIDYDPLAADPDYLIVGRIGRMWRLYEPIISTGAFRLLRIYGDYEIYARVREGAKEPSIHRLVQIGHGSELRWARSVRPARPECVGVPTTPAAQRGCAAPVASER